jgi:hypothetical protein
MKMRTGLALAAIAAVSSLSLVAAAATGGLCVQASSGHPYQSTNWSNYTLSDDNVTWAYNGWAIPIPLDNTGVARKYSVTGTWQNTSESSAWVFDKSGNVQGGYGLTSGTATTISLPAGSYTMFARLLGYSLPVRTGTPIPVAYSLCTRY